METLLEQQGDESEGSHKLDRITLSVHEGIITTLYSLETLNILQQALVSGGVEVVIKNGDEASAPEDLKQAIAEQREAWHQVGPLPSQIVIGLFADRAPAIVKKPEIEARTVFTALHRLGTRAQRLADSTLYDLSTATMFSADPTGGVALSLDLLIDSYLRNDVANAYGMSGVRLAIIEACLALGPPAEAQQDQP